MNPINRVRNIDPSGSDLILLTGVPGSRWSHINKVLMTDPTLNTSDCNHLDQQYGAHKATYFGPFENLRDYSKQDLLDIFIQGFDNWEGRKIIKSHWFLYDLDYLIELFPLATILGVYVPDDISFRRWKAIGGWDITYPDYSWFENDKTMKMRIKEGNAYLMKFFTERGVKFKVYNSYVEMGKQFGIDISIDNTNILALEESNRVVSPLVAVYQSHRKPDMLNLRNYLKNSGPYWDWIDNAAVGLSTVSPERDSNGQKLKQNGRYK